MDLTAQMGRGRFGASFYRRSTALPQRYSSSPSLQSETPSHRAVRSMHLKDERHLYFPEQSKWTEERGGPGCQGRASFVSAQH